MPHDFALGADPERLQAIAWWDWDAATITRDLPVVSGGTVDALEAIAGAM